MAVKETIKKIPLLGGFAEKIFPKWLTPSKEFVNSETYWKERYDTGRNSGKGSYGILADFKAETINHFVQENAVGTVIEYGCGDGNQLTLAKYPSYVGFDISPSAVFLCRKRFANDPSKTFNNVSDYASETAELTLSLDVIYHLIEDAVFAAYMQRLFDSSSRFVIIYSSDTDNNPPGQVPHIKHRKITTWISETKPEWKLIKHTPNKYPFNGNNKTSSFADFFIYQKT